jgi:Domain of unknown function (DUF4166)/Saccharopine dehydrogenase NADP binding domain
MKILIVGGYGTFGGRLVDLLLDQPELTLQVAGRRIAHAQAFCDARASGKATLVPVEFDRTSPQELKSLMPDIVVDASGPYQIYGDDPFALPRACISHGMHYLDLADGAAFVEGISALDDTAKAAGVFVLSGMSSFPVLSAAAGKELAVQLDEVETIHAGIAPSPYAGVGLNVIKAIASYAGQPIELLRKGAWTKSAGFFDSRRMQVHVPGTVPLPPIRFALTEVPDLKVLPVVWPKVKTVWVGAGPTPALLHRLLWLAAGLVKLGILKSLLPLAPLMNFVVNTFRWGEHRGGFVLQMTGMKDGLPRRLSWHLLAEGDGGPLIPSMAVAAVIMRAVEGKLAKTGARSGHDDLSLEDYQPWFDRYGIKTGQRDDDARGQSIYQAVLGQSFAKLDAPLQKFHSAKNTFHMKGIAEITAPPGVLRGLVRKVFGFPKAASDSPVKVDISISSQGEIWRRQFAGKTMRSTQRLGQGRDAGLIVESFGPVAVAMAVVENAGRLELVLRHWRIFGVPMPKFLLPRGQFFEHGADGRFNFHVEIALPLLGPVVKYVGWLEAN